MTLHPSVAAVRRGVRTMLPDAGTVVVACSGGADSLALLSATIFEGHKAGLRVIGATIDHGLQDRSAEHTARVVAQMAQLGVDETVGSRVAVESRGTGPEDAARRARYAVLEEIGRHFDDAPVLLGHTRDDQAETVLLGLARGSGARSLAGMRRSFDRFRRPLVDVGRDDTVTACQVEGITFWHDPHNDDPGYTRVRVRRSVLPVLEEHLGPGVAAALARTADQLRADVDLLDDVAEAAFADLREDGGLPVAALAVQPTAIRRRVIRLAALAAGSPSSELFHEHVVAVDALITDWRGQAWIDLPGKIRASRRDALLVVERVERGDSG